MIGSFSRLRNATLLVLLTLATVQCSGLFKSKTAGELSPQGQALFREVAESNLPWTVWDKSVQQRDIYLLELGSGEDVTVIFGGFHGNERLGAELVFRFAEYLYREQLPADARVILVPVVNPDGLVAGTRSNAGRVDVNRNFPTANWQPYDGSRQNYHGPSPASEPETRAVMALLDKYHPRKIVSVHTPLEVVNYDGPGQALAEAMARHNGYPVKADIGYPTPGSFGTYAGVEKQIPVITLELPRRATFGDIWPANREALWEAVRFREE